MIEEFVRNVLSEDIGRGDLYSLVEPAVEASASIIAKSSGVMAGQIYLNALAKIKDIDIVWLRSDGDSFVAGDIIAKLSASSHALLQTERSMLDMLLHASSIATLTAKYVKVLQPYNIKLLDTRKTRPLLRSFEKYATRTGGATNHRMGLDDCLMLKDTHLKTIDNLDEYIKHARAKIPFTCKIEIEIEDFDMAKRAMSVGADIVMCDNMTIKEIKKVVEFKNKNYSHVLIEASGNITLDTLEDYVQSGIDAISTGSIVHQANWLDISMKMN